jgi:guanylate kinase
MMQKLLGNLKKGLVFVISAPAGTGKTTLARMLFREFDCIAPSISYTTRKPREREVNGRDYHFISRIEFEKKIKEGEFLEHAKVYDEYYGTSRKYVENIQNAGKHVVLVIDTQGALQLMDHFSAVFIFISPPNMKALTERLRKRRSETEESIQHRLSWAEKEMTLASRYDYTIVNEDLPTAYSVLKAIFIAEEHKNR